MHQKWQLKLWKTRELPGVALVHSAISQILIHHLNLIVESHIYSSLHVKMPLTFATLYLKGGQK